MFFLKNEKKLLRQPQIIVEKIGADKQVVQLRTSRKMV